MADFNSSLPVRTQTNGDIVSRISDGTNVSQLLGVDSAGRITIKLDDGNGNVVTSQVNGAQRALDIGINVAGIQIDPRLAGQYNSTLPTLTTGQFTAPQTDINGRLLTVEATDLFPANQTITAQDTASISTVVFNQTWLSGTPTAGSAAPYTLSSNETGLVEIIGTWTGTLVSEVSVDGGTNWIAHAIHLLGSPIFTSSFTGNVMGSINLSAKTQFRIRSTATWTGTATIRVNLSVNASSVYIANAIKLVDGSSSTSTTTATIKAASIAALATDTSFVVALSPNSPLPTGTNTIGSVNQGTTPWVTKDQSDGPVTPGTAASFSQLMGGQFNTALPTLTTGQQSAIQLDSSGRLIISPLTGASIVTVSNFPTTVDTNYGAVGASTIRTASQLGNATGAADFNAGATGAQTLRTTSNQGLPNTVANSWPIKVTDGTNTAAVKAASTPAATTDPSLVVALSPNSPLPAGTNLVGSVNLDIGGSTVSNTNPVPVALVSTTPGTAIQDYHTSVAVAAGSSATFTYTVVSGHTFNLERVWASASGKIKVVVENNGSTIMVGFNSTANPNIDMTIVAPPTIAAAATVTVIITNLDLLAFDLYATIEGNQN